MLDSASASVLAWALTALHRLQVIVCSDGLVSEERRGGGSGLRNEDVAQICKGKGVEEADALADELVKAAQDAGSTDDVTVLLLRVA